jgi:hypothetical protein
MTGSSRGSEPPGRGEVRFETASITRRRSRRPELFVGLVGAFIAVAIAKPWSAPEPAPEEATPAPSTTAQVTHPEPTPATASPSPTVQPLPDPPTEAQAIAGIRSALLPHDGWGVRILEELPTANGSAVYRERWFPVNPPPLAADPGTGGLAVTATAFVAGDAVRAIGVTAPAGASPLDVRVWRIGPAPTTWLDVAPLDRATGAGHLTIMPPRQAAVPLAEWPSGLYRFELLMSDQAIAPVHVNLISLGSFRGVGTRPPPQAELSAGRTGPIGLARTPTGPFVVASGRVLSIDAAASTPLSQAATWFTSLDPAGRVVGSVAPSDGAGVDAIGFAFAPTDRAIEARLEPLGTTRGPAGGIVLSTSDGRDGTGHPVRWFSAPAGPLPAGTWGLEVRSGPSSVGPWRRYVVEIRPGQAWWRSS